MEQLIIKFDKFKNNVITLNASKSESNRLLIIQALSKEIINIYNLSNANDTIILKNLLNKNPNSIWNIKDAGTTMRFLTSFLSLKSLLNKSCVYGCNSSIDSLWGMYYKTSNIYFL